MEQTNLDIVGTAKSNVWKTAHLIIFFQLWLLLVLSLFEGSEIGSYLFKQEFQLLMILIGLFANRPDNTEQENSNIVAKFVRKEANERRSDEDTEGKDCVPGVWHLNASD